ncbi:MAG: YmdB family metallophosphoesterase, partial [Clostridiales bacterium]|nr:YmdB family metallophosphoesterase [Clostridiales bacterium]
EIREEYEIDLCVANAENASPRGIGLNKGACASLLGHGVDVITLGNHTWKDRDILKILDDNENVIRPANYPAGSPGAGSVVVDAGKASVAVINVMGRIYMDPSDCPFAALDHEIAKVSRQTNMIFVDAHCEATSEKCALAHYSDGRVSCLAGTHTHVQTADERVLEGGTAFITDVGMTGPSEGIIGMDRGKIIRKLRTQIPERFEPAQGRKQLSAIVADIDEMSGKALGIRRVWREYE